MSAVLDVGPLEASSFLWTLVGEFCSRPDGCEACTFHASLYGQEILRLLEEGMG